MVDGIRAVSSLIAQDRLRVAASARHLINEFPGYSWSDEHAARGEDAPVKVDDHGIDGLRYGLYTTEALWRPIIEQPILEVV